MLCSLGEEGIRKAGRWLDLLTLLKTVDPPFLGSSSGTTTRGDSTTTGWCTSWASWYMSSLSCIMLPAFRGEGESNDDDDDGHDNKREKGNQLN